MQGERESGHAGVTRRRNLGKEVRARFLEAATAAAAVLAGACLLWQAVPIVVASLIEAPSTPALKRLDTEAVGAAALRAVLRSRERSLHWHERGRTWTDLGLARILQAERGAVPERDTHHGLAERALVRGLALAPMNPYGWMRLVEERVALGRSAEDIVPAFTLALDTGPREDRMLPITVEAGLHLWAALDRDDRDRVAGKVGQAWREDPLGTAAVARRGGQTALLARLVQDRFAPRGEDGRGHSGGLLPRP